MRPRDLDSLPTVLTVDVAAELVDVTRDHLWRLIRENRCPFPVLRLGRAIRIPREPLLEVLGLNGDGAPARGAAARTFTPPIATTSERDDAS